MRKTQGAGLTQSQAAKGQAHPLLPGFKPGYSLWLGSAGPKQTPENRSQPSSQLPCVCFHSCSSCSAVPVSKGICLSEKKNVAERQEAAVPGSPGSLTATEHAKTCQTLRRVTQRPRGQGHRLRDTLHSYPPDDPALPCARTLPRVLTASARLAA